MLRSIFAAAVLLSACAPGPAQIRASEASELLARFAVGAGPADICTPGGRSVLRGAVRAYGAAMQQGGEHWPSVPANGAAPHDLDQVEAAVLIAYTAGFIERSDFPGEARRALTELTFGHWASIRQMRAAADVACDEVVTLQQAAGRFVMEAERYRGMAQGAERARTARAAERIQRQAVRMERAQTAMNDAAAAIEARMAEQRS
jgi:hypothetical protein